jgi:hypothetical protein
MYNQTMFYGDRLFLTVSDGVIVGIGPADRQTMVRFLESLYE